MPKDGEVIDPSVIRNLDGVSIPRALMRRKDIGMEAKMMYGVLSYWGRQRGGLTFLSASQIAKKSGMSKPQALLAVETLVSKKLIKIKIINLQGEDRYMVL